MKKVVKSMQVLLIKDVANLGQAGEIKDVKPGYARNFLILKKFAVLPSDPQSQDFLRERAKRKQESKAQKDMTLSKFDELTNKKIVFKVKVNKKGVSFKAVGAKDIAKKLDIMEDWVKTEPIKALGDHPVLIKSGDLKTQVLVALIPEK